LTPWNKTDKERSELYLKKKKNPARLPSISRGRASFLSTQRERQMGRREGEGLLLLTG